MATVGLTKFYYAILNTDTSSGATYDDPKRITGAIQVDINPTVNKNTLHADNGPFATALSMSEITVTIEMADIPDEDVAALLGHAYDKTKGEVTYKVSDVAPDVAIMAESEKQDGSIRCFKLLKGKFSDSQETIDTKGDSVEFSTPKLEGSFVARVYDGAWKKTKNFAKGASTSEWYQSV